MKTFDTTPPNTSLCLATASLHTIRSSLSRNATPLLDAKTTLQELNALGRRCQEHWSRNALRLASFKNLFFASLLIAAVLLLWMVANTPETLTLGNWLAVLGFSGVLGTLGTMVILLGIRTTIVGLFNLESAERLENGLVPLQATGYGCKQANAYIGKSPSARTYRDAVLQTGRDLRLFDLDAMGRLAQQDLRKDYDEGLARECRILHRIEAS